MFVDLVLVSRLGPWLIRLIRVRVLRVLLVRVVRNGRLWLVSRCLIGLSAIRLWVG